MPYWGGDDADSLSKQTLEARLYVQKLSDRFREKLLLAASTTTTSLQLLLRVTWGFAAGLQVGIDCQSRDEIIMHVLQGCFLTETRSCQVGFLAKLMKWFLVF